MNLIFLFYHYENDYIDFSQPKIIGMEKIKLIDPTFFEHNSKYLFYIRSKPIEIYIFYSDSIEKEFKAHPMNQ